MNGKQNKPTLKTEGSEALAAAGGRAGAAAMMQAACADEGRAILLVLGFPWRR